MITAKVTGIADLRAALSSIPAKLRVRALRNALAAGARVVQKAARAATPVINASAMAVRKATYEYLAAALEGEALEIGTWITASDSRLQMARHFQMRRMSDTSTLFRGDWELVCIRISSGKPVRMPELFLARYEPAVLR